MFYFFNFMMKSLTGSLPGIDLRVTTYQAGAYTTGLQVCPYNDISWRQNKSTIT